MPDSHNILFIKLKSIGDVVFTLPALRLVRENFPAARITYLTSAENEPIVAGFKEVNAVLTLDRKVFKRGNLPAMSATTLKLLREMHRGKFSLAIDFQCYAETAALAGLTRAPQRWGFQQGNRWRRFAYTRALPRPENLHPVDANLELLAHFGLKRLPVKNEFQPAVQGREEAQRLLAENRLNPAKPILFIQPFTSSPNKNWPLAKHLAVATHWRAKGLQVCFGGGPAERGLLQPAIAAGFPVFAGAPLAPAIWLINSSSLVLGSDTGLLHLAVAMGKRVLMLMGPDYPGRCIPYGHPEWVLSGSPEISLVELPEEVVNQAIADVVEHKSAR